MDPYSTAQQVPLLKKDAVLDIGSERPHRWQDVSYHGGPYYICEWCGCTDKDDARTSQPCVAAERYMQHIAVERENEARAEYNALVRKRRRADELFARYGAPATPYPNPAITLNSGEPLMFHLTADALRELLQLSAELNWLETNHPDKTALIELTRRRLDTFRKASGTEPTLKGVMAAEQALMQAVRTLEVS